MGVELIDFFLNHIRAEPKRVSKGLALEVGQAGFEENESGSRHPSRKFWFERLTFFYVDFENRTRDDSNQYANQISEFGGPVTLTGRS